MQRNDEVERITQQRRKRILEVENEVTQLDDLLLNGKLNDSYVQKLNPDFIY